MRDTSPAPLTSALLREPLVWLLVVLTAGLVLIRADHTRLGLVVIVAAGLAAVAGVRLLARPRAPGSLVGRGRHTDVLVLAALAAAIAVLAAVTPLPGGAGQ